MPPPTRKPFFFDSLSGTERTYPDTAADVAWLVSRVASTARRFPDWLLVREAGPVPVTLAVIEEGAGLARIGFSAGPTEGAVIAAADPAGWVRVTVEIAGREVFRAYADQPYEEVELWPADATDPDPKSDPPGRMSKRLWWVTLSAAAWPEIAAAAEGGSVSFEIVGL
jgi:hypothetical protein